MTTAVFKFPNGTELSILHDEDNNIKKCVILHANIPANKVEQIIFDAESGGTIYNMHLLKKNGDVEETIGYIKDRNGFVTKM